MLHTNLVRMIAGILIVVVDVNLGSFDVILDPLGFFLIVGALGMLKRVERNFAFAQGCAVIGLLLSVLEMFGVDLGQPVSLIGGVIWFAMLWLICTGILSLASARGNSPLSESAGQQHRAPRELA